MRNVVQLDNYRPSPWLPDSETCDCAACQVRRIGRDLDDRLRDFGDLVTLEARDAMKHYLIQLGELCGVECQYKAR